MTAPDPTNPPAVQPGLRVKLAGRHGSDTLCLPVGEIRLLVAEIDRLRGLPCPAKRQGATDD